MTNAFWITSIVITNWLPGTFPSPDNPNLFSEQKEIGVLVSNTYGNFTFNGKTNTTLVASSIHLPKSLLVRTPIKKLEGGFYSWPSPTTNLYIQGYYYSH